MSGYGIVYLSFNAYLLTLMNCIDINLYEYRRLEIPPTVPTTQHTGVYLRRDGEVEPGLCEDPRVWPARPADPLADGDCTVVDPGQEDDGVVPSVLVLDRHVDLDVEHTPLRRCRAGQRRQRVVSGAEW